MSRITVQHVLQRGLKELLAKRSFPGYVLRAAYMMMSCRTKTLGGHVQRCPHGHVQRAFYNSCKHRSCPQCSWISLEKWLRQQEARVLDCTHYHVVFTTPRELHWLWRYNRRRMAQLMFLSVRDSLLKLLDDPKYLGARPGMICALHTWGRTLNFHPHIHTSPII